MHGKQMKTYVCSVFVRLSFYLHIVAGCLSVFISCLDEGLERGGKAGYRHPPLGFPRGLNNWNSSACWWMGAAMLLQLFSLVFWFDKIFFRKKRISF